MSSYRNRLFYDVRSLMPVARPLPSTSLILRRLTQTDAAVVARLAGDWQVAKWTASIPHPYSEHMARIWISQLGKEHVYAIDMAGLPHGVVSYDAKSGEIGYWVGRPYWNHGLATMAVALLMERLSSSGPPVAAWGACLPKNLASIRVLEKAGFNPRGEIAIAGRLRHNGARLKKFTYG